MKSVQLSKITIHKYMSIYTLMLHIKCFSNFNTCILKAESFYIFFSLGKGGSYLSLIQYPLIGMSVVIENWVEPPCLSLMRESTGFVQILLLCLNHINLWGLCTCVVKKNHCFMWLEFLSITYPIKIITSV